MKNAINKPLPGPVGNLGRISVQKVLTRQEGSCNFCSRETAEVFRIQGQSLSIRVCDQCAQTLRKELK